MKPRIELTAGLVSRLIGEFLIIVLGVLVALAVDDWAQQREDHALEAELLTRMEAELVADGADLASAEREVRARLWVLDAVLAELGDAAAADRLRPGRLDSLQRPVLVDSLRAAARRGPTWSFDPVGEPMGRAFTLWPEFDLSNDVHQEMLATGSLGIVQDRALRAAIMRYYRTARDQGGNERRAGEFQDRFEEGLMSLGVAPGDRLNLSQLAARARNHPTFSVEARWASNRLRAQLIYYSNIERARRALEQRLRDR